MKKELLLILLFTPFLCFAQFQAILKSDFGLGISSSTYAVAYFSDNPRVAREPNHSASLLLGVKQKKSQVSFWTGYKISSHDLSFKFVPSALMRKSEETFKNTVTQRYNAGHIPLYMGYNFIKAKPVAKRGKKEKKEKIDKEEKPSKWSLFAEAGIQYSYIIPSSYEHLTSYPEQIVHQTDRSYRLGVEELGVLGTEIGAISYHFGANIGYQLNPKISLSAIFDANYGTVPLVGGFYAATVFIIPKGRSTHTASTFSTSSYSALKLGAQYKF